MADLIAGGTAALPLLAPLARWLEELPDTAGGLALSERRVHQALADGPRTADGLFLGSMRGDKASLNGDVWFHRRLAEAGRRPEPAGRRARRARRHHCEHRAAPGRRAHRVDWLGIDRWLAAHTWSRVDVSDTAAVLVPWFSSCCFLTTFARTNMSTCSKG